MISQEFSTYIATQHELSVALFKAASENDKNAIKALLERGALINEVPICSENPEGFSALQIAAVNDCAEAVDLLLSNGARIEVDAFLDKLFEKVAHFGYTPMLLQLMKAAKSQNPVDYVDFPENPKIGEAEKANIKKATQETFEYVFEKIKEAKSRSDQSGKPLCILVGELHFKPISVFLEQIILMAAHQLGVTTYYNERDYSRSINIDYQRKQYLKGTPFSISKWAKQYQMAINSNLDMLAHQLGFQVLDADLGAIRIGSVLSTTGENRIKLVPYEDIQPPISEILTEDNNNSYGVDHRNRVMARIFKKQIPSNILAVVGRLHFKGLTHQESLGNDFELMKFDVSCINELFTQIARDQLNQFLTYVMTSFEDLFDLETEDPNGTIRKGWIDESTESCLIEIGIEEMVQEGSIETQVDQLDTRFKHALATDTKFHLPGNLTQMVWDICSGPQFTPIFGFHRPDDASSGNLELLPAKRVRRS